MKAHVKDSRLQRNVQHAQGPLGQGNLIRCRMVGVGILLGVLRHRVLNQRGLELLILVYGHGLTLVMRRPGVYRPKMRRWSQRRPVPSPVMTT